MFNWFKKCEHEWKEIRRKNINRSSGDFCHTLIKITYKCINCEKRKIKKLWSDKMY